MWVGLAMMKKLIRTNLNKRDDHEKDCCYSIWNASIHSTDESANVGVSVWIG